MPPSHQYQFEKWNPRRILNWASNIGTYTIALMEKIMSSKTHEVRGYRSCMAILNFSKHYDKNEFEMVSKVAVELNIYSVGSIESMLKTKSYLQHCVANESTNNTYSNGHENIRGSEYYSQFNNNQEKVNQ